MTPVIAVAALAMGLVLGLLGGGGSILTVPILVFLGGVPTKEAIATSLLIVAITSAFAVIQHARAGRVRWKTGALFGAVSMVGAFAGGRVAGLLPGDVLMGAFVFVMVVTGVMMLRPRRESSAPLPEPSLSRIAVVGLAMGSVTGLVGAGGGFMIVPALVFFGGLTMRESVATSLFVIALNASSGFAGHLGHAQVDGWLAASVCGAAVVGAFGGTALAGRIAAAQLRQAFGAFVLCMAVLTVVMTWVV
jgi:hypothetical protein